MALTFEWDSRKARSNLAKHGVTFEEAATIFGDVQSLTIPDPEHSLTEERFVTMGKAFGGNCSLSCIRNGAIVSGLLAPDEPTGENGHFMKKKPHKSDEQSMQNDYDFSQAVRGKYA